MRSASYRLRRLVRPPSNEEGHHFYSHEPEPSPPPLQGNGHHLTYYDENPLDGGPIGRDIVIDCNDSDESPPYLPTSVLPVLPTAPPTEEQYQQTVIDHSV